MKFAELMFQFGLINDMKKIYSPQYYYFQLKIANHDILQNKIEFDRKHFDKIFKEFKEGNLIQKGKHYHQYYWNTIQKLNAFTEEERKKLSVMKEATGQWGLKKTKHYCKSRGII